jgi:hypothetical protein
MWKRRRVSEPRQLAVVEEQLAHAGHDHGCWRRLRHLRVEQYNPLEKRTRWQTVTPADVAAADVDGAQV